MTTRAYGVALAGLVVAGVLLRLAFVGSPGFPTDVSTFHAWAERLAELGPAGFYEPGYFSDYPPGFLYVLWLLGALLDGEALRLAIKACSIPFDVGIALVAARVVSRAGTRAHALLAAGLWLLAPGAIFDGAYWGQVDAVGTLPALLAVLAAARWRWALAGALAVIAALVKPQFGLTLLVIVAAAAAVAARRRDLRPLIDVSLVAGALGLALALPFRSGPGELIALVRSAAETYPYTSLYAFNPWSIVADFWKPDEPYFALGGALLLVGIVASCVPLWWRRDTAALLACAACASLAFYFLPTRAHERYLFPALVFLLPLAALRVRILIPYVVLSLAMFATFIHVFSVYDLLHPPDILAATLFARSGTIALALVMTGAAGLVAWRLARGEARLLPALALDRLPRPSLAPIALPAGLAPGRAPRRRDVVVALCVALAFLATRGYRLDHPRDMYFDEVYHARTAFELLAQREVYEWTHPHFAKQLMALGILAFSNDRVTGSEALPPDAVALTVAGDGTRAIAQGDGRVVVRDRDGGELGAITAPGRVRALASDGGLLYIATDTALVQTDLRSPGATTSLAVTPGVFRGLSVASGRTFYATDAGVAIGGAGSGSVRAQTVALTAKPDGMTLYVLDAQGTVRVVDALTGNTTREIPGSPGTAVAYAQGPDRLFVARADGPTLDVIELSGGRRDTVPLANERSGAFAKAATALAVVPRTQFLYALADGRLVVVETHGASPYTSIPVRGTTLAVDGGADLLLVAGDDAAERVDTGRHALAWRLPGVLLGALLAFFVVLLARRLFASAVAPALAGAVVLLDGSLFAQPRIGMNDVYVAAFLIAGWYFVVAAHRPRRSATADLLIAGACFGLALASKWVAAYALGGLALASLIVTARAYARGAPGAGGPLDLLRARGLGAAFLFACFALLPLAIYRASYLPWFGGVTAPFGWDLIELTKQMYWYHSGLTSPHPAGSPWWSWPLVLKPVYWYYGASEGGSAVIYDAGNVVLFWGALAATAWCAVAAVRARSVSLGFVVLALLTQFIAWIPITRVLFFYHFFTALPFYLLALVAALVAVWESGRRTLVPAFLALATASFAFFYPFVSGLPVPTEQSGIFFILPTWQYDCQFYPRFVCDVGSAGAMSTGAVLARVAAPVALALALAGAWLFLGQPEVRAFIASVRPALRRGRPRR